MSSDDSQKEYSDGENSDEKKKKKKLNIRNLKKLEFFKLGARKFPSPKCKKSTINFSGAWEVLS